MILYFSGTGNSRYVARKIAQELNDELISLNQLIKEEKTDELISADKPFIFVCPTYAWRLPIVVTDFIKNKISRKQQSLLCNDLWRRYSKIYKLYSKTM